MASAIAITLGMTALAQTTPPAPYPAQAIQGKIDIRNANIAPATAHSESQHCARPRTGTERRWTGVRLCSRPRPSVGTTVDLSYFGPPPSTVNQSLVGPVQLLNTGQVDSIHGTITIPLYLGHMLDGRNVWYILTDVDDANVADELGLNFSAKLTFAANAARTANFDENNDLVFNQEPSIFLPSGVLLPGLLARNSRPRPSSRDRWATATTARLFRS